MLKFMFWLNTAHPQPEAFSQFQLQNDRVADSTKSTQPITMDESQKLYSILVQKPESLEALDICNDPITFKKITPIRWIFVAKESPSLFTNILERPELAAWVNQFPFNNPHGLLNIATFTDAHLAVAYQHALDKSEAGNVFSDDDRKAIENAYLCSGFTV